MIVDYKQVMVVGEIGFKTISIPHMCIYQSNTWSFAQLEASASVLDLWPKETFHSPLFHVIWPTRTI
jgi:hypothetical protein